MKSIPVWTCICSQTMCFRGVPEPLHWVSLSLFNGIPPEVLKVLANYGFQPCPLHTKVSQEINIDDEISKSFAIWHEEIFFISFWTVCPHSLSRSGDPGPILTSKTAASLGWSFYTKPSYCLVANQPN